MLFCKLQNKSVLKCFITDKKGKYLKCNIIRWDSPLVVFSRGVEGGKLARLALRG